MNSAAALLLAQWGTEGPRPALAFVRRAEVDDLERRYGLALPDDFRAYLLMAAPAEDWWDDEDAIWWPVTRIRNIPDECEHSIGHPRVAREAHTYLFFADFLIWCWAWAICCGEGEDRGKVVRIGADPDRFVAGSFTQFVELYMTDPKSLLHG